MKLNSGGGGKHIATTARKEKPDGTREVSHKVEHHYDTMSHMRSARQYKTQKGVPLAKPLKPRDSSGIHHAIAGHGLGPHDRAGTMESTIRALRDAVLENAMTGDGRLERPSPLGPESLSEAGAADAMPVHPFQNLPVLPYYPLENAAIPQLVPRYKGGLTRRNPSNA